MIGKEECWISKVEVTFHQHCGTVCLKSFGNLSSPLDSSNDC